MDIATTSALISTLSTNTVNIVSNSVIIILGVLAALLGLGYGVRKFRRYISGRKF